MLATEVNCAKSEDEQDRIEALHTGAAFSKKRTEVIHMSRRIASGAAPTMM